MELSDTLMQGNGTNFQELSPVCVQPLSANTVCKPSFSIFIKELQDFLEAEEILTP